MEESLPFARRGSLASRSRAPSQQPNQMTTLPYSSLLLLRQGHPLPGLRLLANIHHSFILNTRLMSLALVIAPPASHTLYVRPSGISVLPGFLPRISTLWCSPSGLGKCQAASTTSCCVLARDRHSFAPMRLARRLGPPLCPSILSSWTGKQPPPSLVDQPP